jgi:hypothetical protein
MATSIRDQAFSLELEPEEIVVRKPKGPPWKKKPKRKKKLNLFKKSSDRHSFTHLAKVLTSGERMAMLKAMERLRGRSRILVELACFSKFSFLRLTATSYLDFDSDALVEIAKYCQYSDTRAAALDELSSNNNALVEVACSSLFKDTRLDAVSFIIDSYCLAEVAARSPNRDSRMAALERISYDNVALRRVAKESSYKSSRAEAVKRLASDTKALCSVIVDAAPPDVKKAAASLLSEMVEELDDTDALVEIAKTSPIEDARFLALGKLSHEPPALRRVIYESRHRDARSMALMLLSDVVPEIDDHEMLAEIAILSPYEDCRAIAVERIADKSPALLSVATRSRFRDARDLALEKLRKDADALRSVSKLSKYRGTRKKAHDLLSKPDVFQKELSKILG